MRGLFSLVAVLVVSLLASDCLAGGFGNAVVVNNRGAFGRVRSQTVVRSNGFNVAVNNNRFRRNNVAVQVNGFNRGANFNSFRFNTFGTRTVADNFGNVFQVDQFGNSRLVAPAVRGFGVSPLGYGYGGANFQNFNSFGVGGFSGCH